MDAKTQTGDCKVCGGTIGFFSLTMFQHGYYPCTCNLPKEKISGHDRR